MPDLTHKTAVITGAANGLGRALARELSGRGFRLALLDIDLEGLEALKQALSGNGQTVSIHHTDIAREEQVIAARSGILQAHQSVDLLINNAGVSISQSFERVTMADLRWLFDINFWGMVYCTRHFLPDLRKAGDSRIVNITSGFALMGFPGKTAYAASKSAIMGFTNALNTELAGSNIKISLVIPPPLNTDIVRAGKHADEQKRAAEMAFLAKTGMPPDRAAYKITSQVLKGKYRVVVGSKTMCMDLIARLFPTAMHRLIGRAKGRFPFS